MKNKKRTVLALMAAVALLAACGSRPDQSVTSGEMVAPEVSSEDLLVSSLEYLLLDNNEEDTQSSEQENSSEQEAEAQVFQNAAEESEEMQDEETVQAEEGVQREEAVIYYGNGGSSDLNQETIEVELITPEELINALARHNIVSLDTKVLAFDQGEQDGALVLYLDLSKAVGEYLRTMSRDAEYIIVASVINTFLENYSADAICLTVEGQPLTTSNAEYMEPLRKCTPEELNEVLQTPDAGESDKDSENNATDEEQSKL